MEATFERVLGQLARVADDLRLLPADAYTQRASLRSQQTELRSRLAELRWEAPAESEDEIQAEIDRLVARWNEVQRLHVDPVEQSGGGGEMGFTSDALEINRRLDAGFERERIERDIRDLRRWLERTHHLAAAVKKGERRHRRGWLLLAAATVVAAVVCGVGAWAVAAAQPGYLATFAAFFALQVPVVTLAVLTVRRRRRRPAAPRQ